MDLPSLRAPGASLATAGSVHAPGGTRLIREGVACGRIYVLESGALEIVRGGVRIVVVREPGAFVGEISALLGMPPTADVVAHEDSTVRVIEAAPDALRSDPALTYAIAQLLARRLQAVTAYLVDIRRQYAGTGTHLALMDQVLADLMTQHAAHRERTGSERHDVPDY